MKTIEIATIFNNTEKLNDKQLKIYKDILIPNLSNEGLKEQINLFTEDYFRYKSFNQLNILIELKREYIKRLEIELEKLHK